MGKIIWITSYPKSGNTWLRAFLANLVLSKEGTPSLNELQGFAPDELSPRIYNPWMDRKIDESTKLQDIANRRMQAQAAIAQKVPGYIFMKTHNLLGRHLGAPTINLSVTDGAIYIVRNPLAVAVSYADFMATTVDKTIDMMARSGFVMPRPKQSAYHISGSWSEHVETWTKKSHSRIHVVRYEDLLEESFATFNGIVKFLNMGATSDQVEAAINAASFSNLKKLETDEGFKEKPKSAKNFFRSGTVDSWKDTLSDSQIDRIQNTFPEQMERFGYL